MANTENVDLIPLSLSARIITSKVGPIVCTLWGSSYFCVVRAWLKGFVHFCFINPVCLFRSFEVVSKEIVILKKSKYCSTQSFTCRVISASSKLTFRGLVQKLVSLGS